MNNKKEYEIVSEQFLGILSLNRDIEIINIVSKYKATQNEIGVNTDHFKYHNYKELFDTTLRNENYTLTLLDDSMIVLNYKFDDDGQILSHNLSFLPNYKNDLIRDGEGLEETAEEDVDISEELFSKRISNYIRIDYEKKGKEEYYHSLVHMHIGVFEYSIRVPFKNVLYPNEFLFLIFKYVYHVDDGYLDKLDSQYDKEVKLSVNELSRFKMVYGN